MKNHWAAVLPLLVVGCLQPSNPDPNITINNPPASDSGTGPVEYIPATPKGTVSGQVLDTRLAPLAGATAKLTIGSASASSPYTTQTDAEGNFLFTGVPAGSQVLVTVSKSGYATLRATATVPASAGEVPIDNGNANVGALELAQTQSSVRFILLTPSGQPAAGAQAYLEAVPAGVLAYNSGSAVVSSSVVAAPVQADASGVITFNNVPSPSELSRIGGSAGGYRLWVDPVDVNGDGVLDAAGYADKLLASDLITSGGTRTLRLGVPNSDGSTTTAAFNLVSTNLPSLQYVKLLDTDPAKAQTELLKKPVRNLLRSGDSIYLNFNQPVAPGSLLALLSDETGKQQVDLTVTASSTGDVYTLSPLATGVREGQEYNLILRATSAYSGAVKTWKGFFVSGDPKTPRAPVLATVSFKDGTSGTVGALDPGECVILSFNQLVTPTAVQLDVSLSTGTDSTVLSFKALPAAPPQSSASCFPSDYPLKFPIDTANFNDATTRFSFVYGSPSSGYPVLQPGTAKAKVDFSRFLQQEPAAYYETAWGSPVPASTVSEVLLSK